MGTCNRLRASLICPRCAQQVETTIDCHFGYTGEMVDLKVGDTYPWAPRRLPQNGGRPDDGSTDGEAYMECPGCCKDSFLVVIVRNDVVVGIEPHPMLQGYIAD